MFYIFFSHAKIFLSEEFAEDVVHNTAKVEEDFGIDNRAARGYSLVYTSVRIMQRLLPNIFEEHNLSEEGFHE